MARVCQVTGKKRVIGNNVSHSKRRTKREFAPNLKVKRFWLEEENRFVTLKVSAAGMRTINKNGLAATLKAAQEKGLIDIYLTEDTNHGKESKRQQSAGDPRVHRAEGQRSSRNLPLHHHQEQKEYNRASGAQEIQSLPPQSNCSQGN